MTKKTKKACRCGHTKKQHFCGDGECSECKCNWYTPPYSGPLRKVSVETAVNNYLKRRRKILLKKFPVPEDITKECWDTADKVLNDVLPGYKDKKAKKDLKQLLAVVIHKQKDRKPEGIEKFLIDIGYLNK